MLDITKHAATCLTFLGFIFLFFVNRKPPPLRVLTICLGAGNTITSLPVRILRFGGVCNLNLVGELRQMHDHHAPRNLNNDLRDIRPGRIYYSTQFGLGIRVRCDRTVPNDTGIPRPLQSDLGGNNEWDQRLCGVDCVLLPYFAVGEYGSDGAECLVWRERG